MLANPKEQSLGCSAGDLRCLCLNKNFFYGLRDCSTAVCNMNMDEVTQVMNYGVALCASESAVLSDHCPDIVSDTSLRGGRSNHHYWWQWCCRHGKIIPLTSESSCAYNTAGDW